MSTPTLASLTPAERACLDGHARMLLIDQAARWRQFGDDTDVVRYVAESLANRHHIASDRHLWALVQQQVDTDPRLLSATPRERAEWHINLEARAREHVSDARRALTHDPVDRNLLLTHLVAAARCAPDMHVPSLRGTVGEALLRVWGG